MRPPVEPEIILPNAREKGTALTDDTLAVLATLLDDAFRIPGTNLRFGLDAVIGLVPGLGDMISNAASFILIYAGWQRGLPQITVARMVANVAIDTLIGAIPFAGDLFDLAWKANRKNLKLLQREATRTSHRQHWRDWLFLMALIVVALALMAVPVITLWLIVQALWR